MKNWCLRYLFESIVYLGEVYLFMFFFNLKVSGVDVRKLWNGGDCWLSVCEVMNLIIINLE